MSCYSMAEQKEGASSNHSDSPLLLFGIHTYCVLQEKSQTWKQSAEGFRFSLFLSSSPLGQKGNGSQQVFHLEV